MVNDPENWECVVDNTEAKEWKQGKWVGTSGVCTRKGGDATKPPKRGSHWTVPGEAGLGGDWTLKAGKNFDESTCTVSNFDALIFKCPKPAKPAATASLAKGWFGL
jgi:hypothetical protein